jgi:hypothetical protein
MPQLALGFSWEDGLNGHGGTATPAEAISVQSGGGITAVDDVITEEAPDSPEIERAQQATVTATKSMSWLEAKNQIQFFGLGTIVEDEYGNVFKVLSARIKRAKPSMATMVITAESLSFDTPIDEFSIQPVELGLNILKHPRYFYAFLGESADEEARNQMVIRRLQDYMETTNSQKRDYMVKELKASIGYAGTAGADQPTLSTTSQIAGTDWAKYAAMEIIQKFWRGEETPYIVGFEITWSQYYFEPPYLIPGGFIENPLTEAVPQLPDYFWQRADATSIFDFVASSNPQCYSDDGTTEGSLNISWLRRSDRIEHQRTWFKITRSWFGSPVGFWDPQLYGFRIERPTAANAETEFLSIN